MTKRSVAHGTFTIERHHPVPPSSVFRAFADDELKRKWFGGPPDWRKEERAMDFRVGGQEISSGGPKDGPLHVFRAYYMDIVPDERIIYAYDMDLDGRRISASMTVIELRPEGKGTRLVFTEHGAFLDGYDDAGSREHGTRELLESLGRALSGAGA